MQVFRGANVKKPEYPASTNWRQVTVPNNIPQYAGSRVSIFSANRAEKPKYTQ